MAVHVGESLGAAQSVASSLAPRGTARPAWRPAAPSNLVFFAIDVERETRAVMTRLPSRNRGTRLFVTTAGDARPRPALLWRSAEGWQLDVQVR
ncbi:MAG: hypothetical protein JNK05_38495 [Myxococcales bacterium]|nr:hypothetical protein [Myxococcales bacterium]